jgi:hypothetical protein
MVHRPWSPLNPLEQPDVRSLDEFKSNISPDAQGDDSKAKSQRQVRERKNKMKQGCQRRAKQRKEAWARYESNLAEYNKRRSEREAKDRRAAGKTHNSPYTKIRELVKEYEAISHPNEEQESFREIILLAALRMQDGKTHSTQPARTVLQKQDNQSQ